MTTLPWLPREWRANREALHEIPSARPNPLESLLGCAVVDLEHASLSQDEILTLAREVATNGTVVAGLTRLRLGSDSRRLAFPT